MSSQLVILVDGTCVFCSRLVAFLLRRGARHNFYFAHLQSDLARRVLARHQLEPDIDTVYAITDYGTDQEQAWADGGAGRQIWPRIYPLATILRFVPLFWLNLHYRLLARVRYRLWGQAPQCIVPSEAQRARFLT